MHRIAALPTGLGQGLYASVGYEAGEIWSPEQKAFLRQDGSAGLVGQHARRPGHLRRRGRRRRSPQSLPDRRPLVLIAAKVSLRGQWVSLKGTGFSLKSTGFSLKSTGFSLKSTGFSLKSTGFSLKSTGFSLKSTGFSLKSTGFSLKSTGFSLKGTGFSPYVNLAT